MIEKKYLIVLFVISLLVVTNLSSKNYKTSLLEDSNQNKASILDSNTGAKNANEKIYQHLQDMKNKDYSGYSNEELLALSKKGDLVAYHHYMIRFAEDGEIQIPVFSNLAIDVYINGSEPGSFLLMADLVSSLTNDLVKAYSYFLVAIELGDQMAIAMVDDYTYRYNLNRDEVEQANVIAKALLNDIDQVKKRN